MDKTHIAKLDELIHQGEDQEAIHYLEELLNLTGFQADLMLLVLKSNYDDRVFQELEKNAH